MKKIYIIICVLSLLLGSCALDNFDEPESVIEGRIVYNGEAIGVRSNALSLLLYQPGYELYTAMNINIKYDGSFHAIMGDGKYKLINPSTVAQPWVTRTDTITFDLKGLKTIDYEVTPFFIINNESFTKSGSNMTATCAIAKVATTATLEYVTLYLSRTIICDQNQKEASQKINAAAITDLNNVSFSGVAITQRLLNQGYCYVRIGVKATQSSELLYTEVQKITF